MKRNVDPADVVLPQVLYHGTFADRVPAIMETGLGLSRFRNYEISQRGVVCMSDDPDAAGGYASDAQFHSGEVVVLEIDAAMLDPCLLGPDGNDEGEFGGCSWEYRGVVPPSAIALLDGPRLPARGP